MSTPREDAGLVLLGVLDRGAIRPRDARARVDDFRRDARESNAGASEQAIREIVADQIIERYATLAAMSGGVSVLAGFVPGIGVATSMLGSGMGNMLLSMKLQVDMTVCLAGAFGWDLDAQETRHRAFVLAASGTLEKVGGQVMTRNVSRMIMTASHPSQGSLARPLIEHLFRQCAGIHGRRALWRAMPFGAGAMLGACGDYALTMHVGRRAKRWYRTNQGPASG